MIRRKNILGMSRHFWALSNMLQAGFEPPASTKQDRSSLNPHFTPIVILVWLQRTKQRSPSCDLILPRKTTYRNIKQNSVILGPFNVYYDEENCLAFLNSISR